jgi:hypothetical protein
MSTELLDGTWEVVPCAVGGLLWPYGIYLIAYLVAIPNDRRPPCDVNLSMTESFLRDSSTAFDFYVVHLPKHMPQGGPRYGRRDPTLHQSRSATASYPTPCHAGGGGSLSEPGPKSGLVDDTLLLGESKAGA